MSAILRRDVKVGDLAMAVAIVPEARRLVTSEKDYEQTPLTTEEVATLLDPFEAKWYERLRPFERERVAVLARLRSRFGDRLYSEVLVEALEAVS